MEYNILQYGADPAGKVLASAAIQAAIDDCAAHGGGRVVIPAGTFLTGTIWLKSHVELHLAHGSLLQASADINDYNEEDAYPQNYCYTPEEWVGRHLLIALECENVALTGTGTIDGAGPAYYDEPEMRWKYCWADGLALSKNKETWRPGQLLTFMECRDVRVENITVRNATCWVCYTHGCDHVQIRGIRVFNHSTYANTDGIDIDCCRYVTVSDCLIDTGDDCIAIRGNRKPLLHHDPVCEYVTITNCVLRSASSVFRIGVGHGTIRHVRVSNLSVFGGSTLFNLMGGLGDSQTRIDDVHFSGVSADHVEYAIQVDGVPGGEITNVSFENAFIRCHAATSIIAQAPGCVKNVRLRDVTLEFSDKNITLDEIARSHRGENLLFCRQAEDLRFDHVQLDAGRIDKTLWGDQVRVENCTGNIGVQIIG